MAAKLRVVHEKIGFLGGGNMTEAIVRGLLSSGIVALPSHLLVGEPSMERLQYLTAALGVATTNDNSVVTSQCDVVFLAVKPQATSSVLGDATVVRNLSGKLLISIVAGQDVANFDRLIALSRSKLDLAPVRIVRVMPNTPFLVGEGACAIARGTGTEKDLDLVETLMRACAPVVVTLDTEEQLNIVTALSGSGPGYIFHLLDALVEAGVRGGLSRDQAHLLAAQTIKGSASLAIHSHRASSGTPAELRDRVTSAGGTTFAGLRVLDQFNFREGVIQAVGAAHARSRELARL